MKLSKRARYGLRALLDILRQEGERPVMLRGISERQGISAKYLEHLLADLRRAGIVRSFRGAGGGFELNRPASEISLLEVVQVLENDFGTTDCVCNPEFCNRARDCAAREVWSRVSEAMWTALEGITIQDLMEPPQDRKGGPITRPGRCKN